MSDDTDEVRRLRAELHAARETIRAMVAGEVDAATVEGEPTLLRKARDSLREREAQLRAIFDGALEAMVIADDEGRYVEANPAAVELFGVPRDELLGRTPAHFTEDLDAETFASSWREFLDRGRDQGTFRVRRPDGEVRIAEYRAAAGISTGRHLSVLRDVTDAQSMARRLGQSHRLESIGRLAGGIAHDFNNMLSVIIGFACFLQEEVPEDDEKREDVDEILEAAQRAADLVQQLLAFGRRQVLSPEPTAVSTLLEGVVRMTSRLIGEHVPVVLGQSVSGAVVDVDATQIEQVMVNLVLNARDAMPNGGTITVETTTEDIVERHPLSNVLEHGTYVVLGVSDDGHGMNDDTRGRVFEPFFSTKGRGKGTGLGLATAYGIVKQSGGHIEVESALGAGSTFSVYLPLSDRQASQSAMRPQLVPELEGSERILVVEDDDSVRKLAAQCLRRLGYQVIEAPDPGHALLVAEQEGRIDLMVSDVVMPRMSGPTLAARLRQGRPALKVVFMSGYAAGELDEISEDDFLPKPFEPTALARMVRTALDRR